MPQRFHVESVYPSHFVADDRNILFACEISQLNIEGFWIPCLVIVLLRCIPAPLPHSTKVSIYYFSGYILINVHIVVSSEISVSMRLGPCA